MPSLRKPSGISAHGCRWPYTSLIEVELDCIRRGGYWKDNIGTQRGLGLEAHIIAFARLVWPWFKWHRWATDLMLPQLVRRCSRTAIFGPSSSSKSCLCGMVALVLYYAHPSNTTVIVTSTTKDDLEGRIWGEIKRFHAEAKDKCDWLPGHLIESKQIISTDGKGEEGGRDLRNGVMGVPVRKGGAWVGLGSLVGRKNTNFILVGDECHLMNEGFLDSIANLSSNLTWRAWFLGNLNDLDSQLGKAAEPEHGWDSVPDSEKSRVFPSRWKNGVTVQLIGQDSPNLDYPPDPHNPDEDFFPKVIGRRYLSQAAHDYGLDTPLYNMFAAGKIPRSTMENRVITKQTCLKFHAFEPVTWSHAPITTLYGADISYTAGHGDRTVGRPFGFGLDVDGKLRFAPLDRPLVYTPSDRSTGSIEDQIASQMIAECKRFDIPPEHVFFDGTGRSSFTAALMRLWSTAVNPVEFGGKASTRPNFIGRRYPDNHPKEGELLPCNEVFGKFVSELWFASRYCVEADQFRNLDDETAKEGFMRLWSLVAGNKMDVEPKADMKMRLNRSPDAFDCLVVGLEGARQLGFKLGSLTAVDKPRSNWLGRLGRELKQLRETSELVTA